MLPPQSIVVCEEPTLPRSWEYAASRKERGTDGFEGGGPMGWGGSDFNPARAYWRCAVLSLASRRRTVVACQVPPRAVLMPRLLSASAIAAWLAMPDARMLATIGSTLAAKRSAFATCAGETRPLTRAREVALARAPSTSHIPSQWQAHRSSDSARPASAPTTAALSPSPYMPRVVDLPRGWRLATLSRETPASGLPVRPTHRQCRQGRRCNDGLRSTNRLNFT